MANIGQIGTKVMAGFDRISLAKYANDPKIFTANKEKILNTDKFERLANEINATKEKYPKFELPEFPELKAPKAPLWKKVIGKIFG